MEKKKSFTWDTKYMQYFYFRHARKSYFRIYLFKASSCIQITRAANLVTAHSSHSKQADTTHVYATNQMNNTAGQWKIWQWKTSVSRCFFCIILRFSLAAQVLQAQHRARERGAWRRLACVPAWHAPPGSSFSGNPIWASIYFLFDNLRNLGAKLLLGTFPFIIKYVACFIKSR